MGSHLCLKHCPYCKRHDWKPELQITISRFLDFRFRNFNEISNRISGRVCVIWLEIKRSSDQSQKAINESSDKGVCPIKQPRELRINTKLRKQTFLLTVIKIIDTRRRVKIKGL